MPQMGDVAWTFNMFCDGEYFGFVTQSNRSGKLVGALASSGSVK